MSRAIKSTVKRSAKDLMRQASSAKMPAKMSGDQEHGGRDALSKKTLELEQAREALHESEELQRGILNTAVNAIITISERGVIQTVNPATERMFGYSSEELTGQNISILMPGPYREHHDGYLARYRETGEKKIIGIGREVVAMRKDGSVFPVDLSVGEIQLAHGRVFTGIIRDISDRKDLEQKILDISEGEQQRIGQDIHDDLCQQLAAIGCLSQVVHQRLKQTGSGDARNMEEIMRLLSQANARAREMARGLVPVVLESEGLMSALSEMAAGTEKVFRVSCPFRCERPVLLQDNKAATQLYRIAQEAVGNAIKHSHADRIEVSLSASNEEIILRIRDNGIGIPDHAPGRGTGLGLLTMSHRARMIGGKLTVEPDIHGGTEVLCVIPMPETAA